MKSITPKEGFSFGYANEKMSRAVMVECVHKDACQAGMEPGDAACKPGYQQPLCAACAEGYTTGIIERVTLHYLLT